MCFLFVPVLFSFSVRVCLLCACAWVFCCVCSCLTVHKGSGGLTFTSARVLVRAPIDGPGCLPNDTRDHTFVKSVFSCPHEPDDHRMCVIAMRLGYLHKLAHAQQDMVISVAPPRPGAHFFLRWHCSPNKRRSPKNGDRDRLTGNRATQNDDIVQTARSFCPVYEALAQRSLLHHMF